MASHYSDDEEEKVSNGTSSHNDSQGAIDELLNECSDKNTKESEKAEKKNPKITEIPTVQKISRNRSTVSEELILGNKDEPIRTRSTFKISEETPLGLVYLIEPTSCDEALQDNEWILEMEEELDQFAKNDVWDLTRALSSQNPPELETNIPSPSEQPPTPPSEPHTKTTAENPITQQIEPPTKTIPTPSTPISPISEPEPIFPTLEEAVALFAESLVEKIKSLSENSRINDDPSADHLAREAEERARRKDEENARLEEEERAREASEKAAVETDAAAKAEAKAKVDAEEAARIAAEEAAKARDDALTQGEC
ncbi:eukaryotic translation initiation factor 4 gamma-like [Lathyrus oleraceus]|uniref:eukaryotic translation initiation factor 4 gamma-like n=1 Tax=Pisum sativum TaxID=3888 RepID=UPI0021CFA60B|nr:eukaryotic translation initiation factor 4 gamma-like [Pisum sativum]